MSRHIYLKKCEELGVVPISLVVRKIGAKELNLRNRQCGPTGARAIAVPLVVSRSHEVFYQLANYTRRIHQGWGARSGMSYTLNEFRFVRVFVYRY